MSLSTTEVYDAVFEMRLEDVKSVREKALDVLGGIVVGKVDPLSVTVFVGMALLFLDEMNK